ncbi:SusC/RagA family TonB-linked outer membrane protein [Chitinophaga caeni]|uniref:SusC/RagA family TonB-linked outer membrane protein n=1 Tax=Chitinophaga caeni TaxID=2029983 RepID=A0A291QY41_9BACT|nr:TonB-dependent receptor [Chitinophaga caeni]ATL48847.1 SusC/RagA family TonB-linked outer membrane protein [Chitinophaga caeni]
MRLLAVILLGACLQVSAKSYAQAITLSEKNAPLETIFKNIEKQTEYVFFFDQAMLDRSKRVTIKVKNEDLKDVLKECLDHQFLTYSIIGKNIVVFPVGLPGIPMGLPTDPTSNFQEIKGKVTDASGMALPGASIKIKNTSRGTVTDANGNFSLNANIGDTLEVSYLGYKTREIMIQNAQPLDIILQSSVNTTDEIVVVGYGTVKKSDLTGSLSQVKSKDLTAFPTTNVMQALTGRASGVRVIQNNGAPGGSISVRIRGVNSILGGNEPLYVIDGFPYNGNPTFLQNSDIESIEILKDASSIAIYGSRGANGVVLITTKSGKKGGRTTVDFDAGYTVQSVTKKMKLMNASQYALLYNEQAKNDNLSPYFTDEQLAEIANGPSTDWQDLVLRTAPMFVSNVTVNGGSEKTRFSLSGGTFLQQGIIKNSNYKRYSVRGNIDHDISKYVSVSFNAILTRLNSRYQNSGLGNRGSDLISAMLMAPPTLGPYLEDGSYRRMTTAYPFISNALINPMIPINEINDGIQADRVFSNAAVTVKPVKDLVIKISGGIENSNDRTDYYANIEPSTNSVGTARIGTKQLTSLLNENVATYSKQFGKHGFTLLGGFTYQDYVATTVGGSGVGFLSDVPGTGNLGSAATPGIPNSSYTKWTLLSYIGRLNYNYNDKYLATVSFRRDGSSRYSENNKWGNFPSAALAWRISQEDFMKSIGWLSDLKIRTSYGATGSTAINPYQTLNQLSSSNTIFGDALYTAFAPGGSLPGNLKWETTHQFDAGIDASVLDNRVHFTADYYVKKTSNLLNRVELPASMGYDYTVQNIGEIENRGMEFGVEANLVDREVKWNVNANISFNRNKVLKLYDGQDINGSSFYTGSLNDFVNILREGKPLGVFYGYQEDGYTDNGNLQYVDRNKDGNISADDKTFIGDPNPDFIYGLNSTTSFKNFELTFFIQGSQGNDIYNLNQAATLDLGMGLNLPVDVYNNHWTPENTNTKYPKISRSLSANMSDRFVEDGSYLRFRTIQLAYNLPVSKWSWKGFRSAQIYVSGQNLITFTKYSWYDPDVNAYGSSNSINQGIDYATYPTNKSVTFGIKCGF